MRHIDVFLCYRRAGAQTAKLFNRYIKQTKFPADVWYSDEETYGNYKHDIKELIGSAKGVVLFIDNSFTRGFLKPEGKWECITALEIIEIEKRIQSDPSFRIIEVFLNREGGLTLKESATLKRLFKRSGILRSDSVEHFSQSNSEHFQTATGNEEVLFSRISKEMLPDEYYEINRSRGNFYFGTIPTYVDIVLSDFNAGLLMENISFVRDIREIELYKTIKRTPANEKKEIQNNEMISFVGAEISLSDNDEKKMLKIRYESIEYELFYKAIQFLNASQLGLHKAISTYKMEDEVYQVPNAMGLAFMVVTADNKLVLTKRSAEPEKIRSGQFDVSIVEGLKPEKITEKDFVESEIKRAYNEEICKFDEEIRIKLTGLVIDKEYGQWNLIGTIFTNQTSEQIMRKHPTRDDNSERQDIFFVPYMENGENSVSTARNYLASFIHGKFWGMGLATLYSALRAVGFTDTQIEQISK